jgi:hypothetical protein
MEQLIATPIDNTLSVVRTTSTPPFIPDEVSTSKPFIEANTVESSLNEISNTHIIPVFIKDNEPVISQVDFIESASQIVSEIYHGEHILKPNVRLSHPIKGRKNP